MADTVKKLKRLLDGKFLFVNYPRIKGKTYSRDNLVNNVNEAEIALACASGSLDFGRNDSAEKRLTEARGKLACLL